LCRLFHRCSRALNLPKNDAPVWIAGVLHEFCQKFGRFFLFKRTAAALSGHLRRETIQMINDCRKPNGLFGFRASSLTLVKKRHLVCSSSLSSDFEFTFLPNCFTQTTLTRDDRPGNQLNSRVRRCRQPSMFVFDLADLPTGHSIDFSIF